MPPIRVNKRSTVKPPIIDIISGPTSKPIASILPSLPLPPSILPASDNDWAGMLYDGENYCFSKSYHLHIVDRVGGGDSFGGGLIYALLSGKDTQSAIEFAVAASALKHSVEGDYNRVSVSEVEKLAGGDGSGRVQR